MARLQSECPPGGICVSRSVRDHVHGRLGLDFQELGALDLKNIARPVEAFAVRLDASGTVIPPLVESAAGTPPLPEMPSIAVLAFTNMSRDPEQEYLSDGIVEEIITNFREYVGSALYPAIPALRTRESLWISGKSARNSAFDMC